MKRIGLILFLILMTSLMLGEIKVSGYYKTFFTGLFPADYLVLENAVSEEAFGLYNSRIRLNFQVQVVKNFNLEVAYDISPRISNPHFNENLFGELSVSDYRIGDLNKRIYPKEDMLSGDFGLYHNLDRFYFTFNLEGFDIYIGRQAISFGSARFINPTDIISPFAFNELDVEDKRGVDAIRVRIPFGMMDEIDFGYVIGEDFKFGNSAFFVRGKFYILNTDLSLIFMGFREHLMLGWDLTRAIGGAGFWIEGAYVMPNSFSKSTTPEQRDNYLRVSLGFDYNFKGGWYTFVEYHLNSAGKNSPDNYLKVLENPSFTDGAVYLMGRHYLNLGIIYQLHPLVPVTGMFIYNIKDKSLIFAPSAEYNIKENIYLAIGAYIGFGKKYEMFPHFVPTNNPPIQLHSEFGAYPDMVYTAFRIYF